MTTLSSTPSVSVVTVTVTVWAVFQLPVVKVRVDGEKVGLVGVVVEEPVPRVRFTVTLAEGWTDNATV